MKVIQSLAAHPKLVNFVMTILTKLVSKQVGIHVLLKIHKVHVTRFMARGVWLNCLIKHEAQPSTLIRQGDYNPSAIHHNAHLVNFKCFFATQARGYNALTIEAIKNEGAIT